MQKMCEYNILRMVILFTDNRGRKMSPSYTIHDNQNGRITDASNSYVNPLRVIMKSILRDSINHVVFTQMSKRSPIVSTQHGSRVSCSVYACVHVDL